MLTGNHEKEKSMLIARIKEKGFRDELRIESVNPINKQNFNNTLFYNKNLGSYIANVNYCKHNYKLTIPFDGKANSKYEKSLKKVFLKL